MASRTSPWSIVLELAEQAALEHFVRSTMVPQGLARRARIILHLAAGVSITHTARQVGVQRRIVRYWGQRFLQHRLPGLADRPRPGRPPAFTARQLATARAMLADPALTVAEVARQLGVAPSTLYYHLPGGRGGLRKGRT
jgi:transposase-like protein